jgi:predicted nucleotidyltransferase component of viral defense system
VISPDALNAWRANHPWADDDQIEQDLIMTRVAVEIASHPELRERLAWRGGTCLHKRFLPTALRYSEDLDYVAYDLSIEDNDMRKLRMGLREVAERIGLEVTKHAKTTRSRLTEHFAYTSLGGANRRGRRRARWGSSVPASEPPAALRRGPRPASGLRFACVRPS